LIIPNIDPLVPKVLLFRDFLFEALFFVIVDLVYVGMGIEETVRGITK